MQPLDVLRELGEQFPRQRDELKGRARAFVQVLEPLSGPRLRQALDATMAGWQKSSAPWPKEIALNAPAAATAVADRVSKTEQAFEMRDRIVNRTLTRYYRDIVDAAGELGITEAEFRGCLTPELMQPAWNAAERAVVKDLDEPSSLDLTAETFGLARSRAISRDRIAARRAGSFKPLRQAAQEIEAEPERKREIA